jgi:ubiquinone/menaquinone biosynthesis C-methylase UbiE
MTVEMPASGDLRAHKQSIPREFTRVARGYDLLCALNPGYARHLRRSAERLDLAASARILDLCCGTGLSTLALRTTYPRASITGMDASSGMLEIARRKRPLRDVAWLEGDAMDPRAAGAEGPFDGILMAYGIRNVLDPDRCLTCLFDLLRPGGTLGLHEYSVAGSLRSEIVWKTVTAAIVIPFGLAVTGTTSIFRYLRRSVLAFDDVERLEARLRGAGFIDVRTEPMDGWQRGIVHSFLARRPS